MAEDMDPEVQATCIQVMHWENFDTPPPIHKGGIDSGQQSEHQVPLPHSCRPRVGTD